MLTRWKIILAAAVLLSAVGGCGGIRPTVFLNPEYNFDYVERVAVIPFENLTSEQGAAYRTTRIFVAELMATETFEVVEPGEVAKVMEKYGTARTADLAPDQIVAIGKELKVQGLILGSVGEAGTLRSGGANTAVMTLVVRMVETDKGTTVWSVTNTEGGRSFWASLFGTGERSESEVTRRCVVKTIKTLVK